MIIYNNTYTEETKSTFFAVPNETHSNGDSDNWEDFEVIDPKTGKKVPDEGHANRDNDDWDDFEIIDPKSGKKVPDEGHAATDAKRPKTIFITEQFYENVHTIYSDFTRSDHEYPAMGITIHNSAIFVECVTFPDEIVVRRPTTDEVKRSHPAFDALWKEKLEQYQYKCRTSTVHIHPMNFANLSSTDIRNFDRLRLHPDDPSTFSSEHPYPVILINLNAHLKIDILGFWVINGDAVQAPVVKIPNNHAMIESAWQRADALPEPWEDNLIEVIQSQVAGRYQVDLGINTVTGERALKVESQCDTQLSHVKNQRCLLRFDGEQSLSLRGKNGVVRVEQHVDWLGLFDELMSSTDIQEVENAIVSI